MAQQQADSSSDGLVTVTEQLQLRTLGFGIGEVSWSSVRVTSDDWICVLHKQRAANQPDRKLLQATVIDPLGNQIRSLQLDGLTSAQVSPFRDVIALSTAEKIYTVCLKTNAIISWNRFPCDVVYWSWVGKSVIGMIGRQRIYHWLISSDNLSFVVNRSPRLRNTQITNYQVRKRKVNCGCAVTSNLWQGFSFSQSLTEVLIHQVDRCQGWHVLQALKSNSDGSITGLVQVYSTAHCNSTVLEAEATAISAFKFAANSYTSSVLVLVNKACSTLAKISVVELGPQKPDRNLLVHRSESFRWNDPDDIVTSIVPNPESALIYVLSKKGMLFVFSSETCCPFILNERICCDIVFISVLDKNSGGVLAFSRNGQVLSIHAQLNQPHKVPDNHIPDQVTRL
jgi:hypothetical protein